MNSITVCTDRRDVVEGAGKGMKVFDTPDNSTFRECGAFRTRSSFKRFLYCDSKALGRSAKR